MGNQLSNPLLVSAGITTTLAFAISGYGLYELLAIDSEEPQPDLAANRQSTPAPSAIAPNTAAPEPLELGATGNRAQLASWTGRSSAAVPASRLALMLLANGNWQTPIAPVFQHVESQVDELAAKGFLQAAFTQAEQGDFVAAIRLLKQIPAGATSYDRAQIKIAEYKQNEAIQAEAQLRRADALANIKDYSRARVYLKQVPEESSTYEVAKAKMTEFATQEDIQAYAWLREANVLAAQGKLARAIECLKRIPLGTSAYTQAQDKIAQYSPKPSQSAKTAQQPTRPSSEIVRWTPPPASTETATVRAAQPSVRPSSELSPVQPISISPQPPAPQRLVRRSEPPAYTRQTPPAPPAPTAEFAPTTQTTVQPRIAPVQPSEPVPASSTPRADAQTVGNPSQATEVVPLGTAQPPAQPPAQPQVVEANRQPQTPAPTVAPTVAPTLVRATPSAPNSSTGVLNARTPNVRTPNARNFAAPPRISAAAIDPSRQLREVHPQPVVASPVGDRW